MTGCCNGQPRCKVSVEDVKDRIVQFQVFSVVFIVVGIVSVSLGIPTVIYAAPNPSNPFTSGTGIYTGVSAVVCGIFGILLLKEIQKENPLKAKCLAVAMNMLLQIQTTLGPLHCGFSIWSTVVCFMGDGGKSCGGDPRSALSLLGILSSIVGMTVFVMGIVGHVLAGKMLSAAGCLGNKSQVGAVSA